MRLQGYQILNLLMCGIEHIRVAFLETVEGLSKLDDMQWVYESANDLKVRHSHIRRGYTISDKALDMTPYQLAAYLYALVQRGGRTSASVASIYYQQLLQMLVDDVDVEERRKLKDAVRSLEALELYRLSSSHNSVWHLEPLSVEQPKKRRIRADNKGQKD